MTKQSSLFEKLPRELQPVLIAKIANVKRWEEPAINSLVSWFDNKGFYFSSNQIKAVCTEINHKLSNAKPHSQRLGLSLDTVISELDRLNNLSGLYAEQSTLNDEITALEHLIESAKEPAKLNGLRARELTLNNAIALQESVILKTENRNRLLEQGAKHEP